MTENKIDPQTVQFRVNDRLPLFFIDASMIANRSDGMAFIRLLSMLPEGIVEQVRFVITTANLKILIDALCAQADHYPTKPTEPQTDKKQPAKPAS